MVHISPLPLTMWSHGSGLTSLSFSFLLCKMETQSLPALTDLSGSFGKWRALHRWRFQKTKTHSSSITTISTFSTLDRNLSKPCYTFSCFLKQKILKGISLFLMTQGHVGCINFRYFCLLLSYLGVTVPVSDSPQNPPSFLGCCCWDAVGWEARQPSLRIIWGRRERERELALDCRTV